MAENPKHQLLPAEISKLKPTQMTAGFAEVARKRAEWAQLNKKARHALLTSHWFPAVLGPGERFYIVDHHHLGLALHEEGVATVSVMQLADLSYLTAPVFWRMMEAHNWVHPFDPSGKRRDYGAIPAKIDQLEDDSHRSLAGFLRAAGGYAKDTSPFAEFLWADYLRPHISRSQIRKSIEVAVREALGLAKSPLARYLPGWVGIIESTATSKR